MHKVEIYKNSGNCSRLVVYDSNGNKIYYSEYYNDKLLSWERNEYDSDSNIIYRELSNGSKCYFYYRDNKIYCEEYDASGECEEEIHVYDFKGRLIRIEYKPRSYHEYATSFKYNSDGKLIYRKDSDVDEESIWEYDSNGNEIHCIDTYSEEEQWSEYDENNNLIHYRDSKGYEYWLAYDKNNNEIYSKTNKGVESWSEYDENNNLIHYRDSKGSEKWIEYDSNNNKIHTKNSEGFEEWWIYHEI